MHHQLQEYLEGKKNEIRATKVICCPPIPKYSESSFSNKVPEETPIQKLARKWGKMPLDLPVALRDDNIAKIALYAVKKVMAVEDPAIVIQWNFAGFNDVPAVPGFRNGDMNQSKQAIVTHFIEHGGVDVKNLNTVFVFRSNNELGEAENKLPKWVRHQNGVPDVCESAVIHKVTSSGQIDVTIFRYAFNR
ncbi:uncharacterized protein OCT59_014688 [Rhizophagus irregularis]|nr:hypothetical protein OCT59_014688 [Rhizophagus irregularis]GBC44164.2 hypothetical protein GLOIN_2v1761224 [Rhizophagus irregularis DAOM 181602=DAOM 197198]CAG8507417.1 9648_t:CDS:2 [Rhizophagus irregularis]